MLPRKAASVAGASDGGASNWALAGRPSPHKSAITTFAEALRICGLCKRKSDTPNPTPNKVPGPLLSFCAGRVLRCTSCRNWCRQVANQRKPKDIQDDIDADDTGEKQKEYTHSLEVFESKWDAIPGYWSAELTQSLPVPTFLRAVRTTGTVDTLNLGVFWPKTVWEVEEKTEPYPENKSVKYPVNGVSTEGVWRCKTKGEPPGTLTKAGLLTNTVEESTNIADSSVQRKVDYQRTKDDALALARGVVANKKQSADGDGEDFYEMADNGAARVIKRRKLERSESQSDDDLLLLMPTNRLGKCKRQPSPHDSASDSQQGKPASRAKAKGKPGAQAKAKNKPKASISSRRLH